MKIQIDLPMERLIDFCKQNQIQKMAVFGSVLREDFSHDSDIDILVEFKPDARVGLNFFRMEHELSEILGRKVDLNTLGFLSKQFRDEVLREAEVLYDAA